MVTKPIDITIKKRISPETWTLLSILVSVTVLSTLILFPQLLILHEPYRVGDIADKNIKATADLIIEDKAATEQKRIQARKEVLTVYDYDRALLIQLIKRIEDAFNRPRSKADFEKTLGLEVSQGAYALLEKEGFSKRIPALIINILSQILNNGVVSNKEMLLKENERGIVLKTLDTASEEIERNLKHFYGIDQSKAMVRIIGEPLLKDIDYTLVNLIVDFTQRLIRPNITINRSETEKRRKEAEASVKPIFYQIKKGEMILREGERVTPVHLVKLKMLREQTGTTQVFEKGIGTGLIILTLLAILYLIQLKYQREILYDQKKNLVFIGGIVVIFLLILQLTVTLAQTMVPNAPVSIPQESILYGIPLAGGAMTICLFLGSNIAFSFAVVMALMTATIFENSYELGLYFLLNGIMGAYWIRGCKERKGFIKAGVKVGGLNILLALIIDIYLADLSGFKLLWDCLFAFFGGVIAGIITGGIAPLMEMAFGYATESTLLELANLDQPLLRRLMLEAPGTYHHSMIVGSMVEAAASEIGASPLLAKVCGYYHDIGKLKNPLYFIENQKDGKNIHNKLAPSMSCLILISHVKNGVELARENKLGQPIIDAITQHHGTTLISFFYEKAKKLKKDQVVNVDDFRYPGPKPQTRETALVMLADVVEAAARTLEDPTLPRIQGLVQQLINKLFSDNQLDECPLTLKDLNNIARSFNKILNGIYHHRVEYPEPETPEKSEEKNGNTDQQPPEAAPDINPTAPEGGPNPLKRLGQS